MHVLKFNSYAGRSLTGDRNRLTGYSRDGGVGEGLLIGGVVVTGGMASGTITSGTSTTLESNHSDSEAGDVTTDTLSRERGGAGG